MRDLGEELVQAALDKGLISQGDQEKVRALVEQSTGKVYAAQILVRERMISCSELLTLQNNLQAKLYECPSCHARFPRSSLPEKQGKTFRCKGCKKKVVLDQTELTRIEVLTSRDPLDMTITLGEVGDVESSSEVSAIDLNRYEVKEELGRGGYGVVFKAFHRDLERDVALKILRPSNELPRLTLERFIREGRSASRLQHPNLVGVYDIGQSRDLYALAMEFVPGKSLKSHIKDRKRYPWAEALEMMDQILAGVGHAHENGIIHRDLKPTNVIVDERTGSPRIIDFGLAKDLESDATLTAAGAIVGTPYYLSPEQIEGRSAKVDARSDIFALGVILYFMIAGKRPFDSKLKSEIYAQILKDEPAPLSDLVSDLPEGLEDVIAQALAKKRSDRFADVGEMRAALAEISEGATPTKKKRKTKTGRTRRKTDKRPAVSRRQAPAAAPGLGAGAKVGIGVGAIALVLVLGFAMGRGSSGGGDVADSGTPAATGDGGPGGSGGAQTPAGAGATDSGTSGGDSGTRVPKPTGSASTDPASGGSDDPEAGDGPSSDPEAGGVDSGSDAADDPGSGSTRVGSDPADGPELGPGAEASAGDPGSAAATDPGDATPDDAGPEAGSPAKPVAVEPIVEVALDQGKRDADEFPVLAGRKQRDWLKRAFYLNAVSDEGQAPRHVRALRLGLNDRFPLNRAFALRGLLRYTDGAYLRAHGSQALFDALLDQIGSREGYVAKSSQVLLARMGGGEERSRAAWKRWWKEEGEATFLESARNPPDVKIPPGEAKAGTERLETRTRNITEYFSKLRNQGLDIVFLLDVTMSMTDELLRMRQQINEITSFMDLLLKGKVRMGFVTYGDQVVQAVPLTKKLGNFAREVETITIFNDPNDRTIEEGISKGLELVLSGENKLGWRKKAQRTVLLLGDAPPLDPQACRDLATLAGEKEFTINALIAKPPAKYAHKAPNPLFEEMAKLSKGLTAELESPEELITRILVFAFGSNQEVDLRRFVGAYREITGVAAR